LVHGLVVFSWYDVITCESSVHTFIRFFLQYSYFWRSLIFTHYILKTYDQQFTLTTKKSLHIIFKVDKIHSDRDVTVICDLYVVRQHGVLCEVKWWRFVALFERNWINWFKKMSALSLRVILILTITNISQSLPHIMAEKQPLLCLTPPAEGFPWDDLRKIFHGCQWMTEVPNAVKILPKTWTAWVGRTIVTDDRQTDGRVIAYSEREREREFTFAKMG